MLFESVRCLLLTGLPHPANILHRLYEQQKTAPESAVRLDEYVTCWRRWSRVGSGDLLGAAGHVGATTVGKAQPEQVNT